MLPVVEAVLVAVEAPDDVEVLLDAGAAHHVVELDGAPDEDGASDEGVSDELGASDDDEGASDDVTSSFKSSYAFSYVAAVVTLTS